MFVSCDRDKNSMFWSDQMSGMVMAQHVWLIGVGVSSKIPHPVVQVLGFLPKEGVMEFISPGGAEAPFIETAYTLSSGSLTLMGSQHPTDAFITMTK
ncbi:hypothetical protein MLD38_033797 [Melastoma candidum]|uniref:Uncharacterized protein n=1 Tax=Melastoma candidum TaxID=119954 RepID=A0ACB9M8G8_9MYRT|nr:hypothetical protein MLD38_033797 [Melastoma candidum]